MASSVEVAYQFSPTVNNCKIFDTAKNKTKQTNRDTERTRFDSPNADVDPIIRPPSPPVPLFRPSDPAALVLHVKRLTPQAILPIRASAEAAGLDLHSAREAVIKTGERALVQTDLQIAVPKGYYGRIAPRSGLALRHGIDVGAGVIDADYRGALGIVMFNFGKEDFKINAGDRVAQLICEKIALPEVVECPTGLPETQRGDRGFGSTGGFSQT